MEIVSLKKTCSNEDTSSLCKNTEKIGIVPKRNPLNKISILLKVFVSILSFQLFYNLSFQLFYNIRLNRKCTQLDINSKINLQQGEIYNRLLNLEAQVCDEYGIEALLYIIRIYAFLCKITPKLNRYL